nr:hypothetical protein [Dinophyceae sp. MRD-151]
MAIKIPGLLIKIIEHSIYSFLKYQSFVVSAFLLIKRNLKFFTNTFFNFIRHDIKKCEDEGLQGRI